ncbi:MAG: aldo/keto reductase [Chloroflexi bacterium]|nr:aldo/keto reductase [Chloroflexota bacterium]
MKLKRLGNTGLLTSDIALGTMIFGETGPRGTPPDEAERIIHAYLDAGGNHLDTANIYAGGRSEEITGKAVKGVRDQIILATKVNAPMSDNPNYHGLSRFNIIKAVEDSLSRLDTDYIDLYYMHCWDFNTPIEESLRAFDDLVRQGKVLYIGMSNFKAWQVMKSLAVSDASGMERFVAGQFQYSLVIRDIEYEFFDLFESEGIGLTPWGPLGGGFLTGKYQRGDKPDDGRIAVMEDDTEEAWHRRSTERNWAIIDAVGEIAEERGITYSQVAVAWTRQQPTVSSVIVGVRTMEQLEDNLGAADIELSDQELQRLDKASRLPEMYPYRFIENYGRRKAED